MRNVLLAIACLALVFPMAAAQPDGPGAVTLEFFPAGGSTIYAGVQGHVLALEDPAAPTSTDLSTADPLGVPMIAWYAEMPWSDDLEFVGSMTFDVTLSAAYQVLGSIDAKVVSISPSGLVEVLGSVSAPTAISVAPRTQSFSIALGSVLNEEHVLGIQMSVSGADVLVTVDYGTADLASASVDVRILDTDGDGFGDSLERRLGTNPNSDQSYPRGIGPNAGTDDDDASAEGVVASILILTTLGIAGFALLRRFSL